MNLMAAIVAVGPSITILSCGVPMSEHSIFMRSSMSTYVEAKVGSEYAIKLSNPKDVRIGVLLEVDGVNVIDAKDGSESLWIVPAHSDITIPGWQVSGSTARKFTFSDKKDSYAHRLGRKSDKVGTIKATFYDEYYLTWSYTIQQPVPITNPEWANPAWLYCTSETSGGTVANSSTNVSSNVGTQVSASSLGTAMGERTENNVTEVAFSRGSLIGSVEIRYVTKLPIPVYVDPKFCREME